MCTAAVWGLLLGLRTWTSARQRRRPRSPFPQPSSATRVRKISTRGRPCLFASRPRATSSTTRSSRRASRRMSIRDLAPLPGQERRVLRFYCRKRESIFAQLTPGNSVHRPIDLESSDEEDTAVEDMRVGKTPRFAPHRLLSDSALTLRATNQATGVLKQKTPAEPLISPAPPQAAIKKIARFLSPDKKSRRAIARFLSPDNKKSRRASPRTRFLILLLLLIL